MVQVPCLEDYLDLHKFTLFISFRKAKGCTSNTIKGHFHQFQRVVQWFMARPSSSAGKPRANQLSEMPNWQQRHKQQLTYSMPRPTKDPADFAAQGHWVDSPVVVLAIEETRDTVLEMLEKHGRWVWVWPQAYCCALDPKWSEVVDCTQVVGEWP
jgi:hypothetical protein